MWFDDDVSWAVIRKTERDTRHILIGKNGCYPKYLFSANGICIPLIPSRSTMINKTTSIVIIHPNLKSCRAFQEKNLYGNWNCKKLNLHPKCFFEKLHPFLIALKSFQEWKNWILWNEKPWVWMYSLFNLIFRRRLN